MSHYPPLSLAEVFGLSPLKVRMSEVALMLKGDPYTPPSRFDRSSLNILKPSLSVLTWLGWRRPDRRLPIYNLFNHTQTPVEEGWSVRFTQVRDFRGKRNTYDSHNGTDFAIPVGTIVTAAAPGVVRRVSSEFHRGGLKVVIDHGHGVITTSNHLGRALVQVGQRVARGEPVALGGGSGVDMVGAFPWSCPHVHYNTWLNGLPVDPFAPPGELPLWRHGNEPVPYQGPLDDVFPETAWALDALEAAIDACLDPALARTLRQVEGVDQRAVDTIFAMNYYPTRFSARPCLYAEPAPRAPLLDLPFRPEDYVGIVHLDD